MSDNARVASLGLAAGFVGGIFGIGGGVVIVPGLVLWLAMDQHRAHATSIAAILPKGVVALIPFAVSGEVDWAAAAAMAVGAIVGAYFGARFIARIPAVWLARAFFVVLVVAAARMFSS